MCLTPSCQWWSAMLELDTGAMEDWSVLCVTLRKAAILYPCLTVHHSPAHASRLYGHLQTKMWTLLHWFSLDASIAVTLKQISHTNTIIYIYMYIYILYIYIIYIYIYIYINIIVSLAALYSPSHPSGGLMLCPMLSPGWPYSRIRKRCWLALWNITKIKI